jgi:heat-inducible transcriptional repressor
VNAGVLRKWGDAVLTPRQKLILSAVVEDYVRSAEPVGSRSLSKHQDFNLSSATIRNEMADLEELGFLDQPHTSAGRIPSHKGYRFYVDHLAGKAGLDEEAVHVLRKLFRKRMDEVEQVIQQTSVVLSQLTQYTSIVLGPQIYQDKIQEVQLIPLSGNKAVAILVTDTGQVSSRQVQLSEEIASREVAEMVEVLNQKLRGTPLSHLRSHLYREIANEMASSLEHFEDAIAVLDELSNVVTNKSGQVYVGGTTNILVQPEFRDVNKVRPVLELLEHADYIRVQHLLPTNSVGLQVRIGVENNTPTLQDCTVISSTYSVAGIPVGSIGVLGPTRMNYARVIQILEYASRALTRVMNERVTGS